MRRSRATLVAMIVGASLTLPAAQAQAVPIPLITCITTVVLPTGQLGSIYQAQITSTAVPVGTYSATGLPAGLTISSAGLITGTPTASGTFSPTFKVNSGLLCGTRSVPLTVKVDQHANLAYWRPNNIITADTPQDVPGLTDVTGQGTDDKVGLFLRGDGSVWLWADYYADSVGDAPAPVQYITPSHIIEVSGDGGPVTSGPMSDEDAGFALRYDGTVWSWGDNTFGQLGHGTIGGQDFVPKQVVGLHNVVAISSSRVFAYALTSDGRVWGWGWNYSGPLGDNAAIAPVPVLVTGFSNIVAIATGNIGYGLRSDGTVMAIGYAGYGELGSPTTFASHAIPIPGLSGVTAIAAGGVNGYALAGGHVFSWGANDMGELGIGTNVPDSWVPVQVSGLSGVSALGASPAGGYAIVNGRLWAWGEYDADGTFGSYVPVLSPIGRVLSASDTAALHLPLLIHPIPFLD
jgi:hypothetical protein